MWTDLPGDLTQVTAAAASSRASHARIAEAYREASKAATPADAAAILAAAGLRIIVLYGPTRGGCSCPNPKCTAIGKHPRLSNWPATATTSPTQIRDWEARWPGSNYGVVTGVHVDVLDSDGAAGLAALTTLWTAERQPNVLAIVETGGGGLHVVIPATGHPAVVLATGAGAHEELRLKGTGGYVVAPGSVHGSGVVYSPAADISAVINAFATGSSTTTLKAVLPWEAPIRGTKAPASQTAGAHSRHLAYTTAALAKALRRVAAETFRRNDRLHGESFSIGRLAEAGGLDQSAVETAFVDAATIAGLTRAEATATFRSGYAGGLRRPKPILVTTMHGSTKTSEVLARAQEQLAEAGLALLVLKRRSNGTLGTSNTNAAATDWRVMEAVLEMATAQNTLRPRVSVLALSAETGFPKERCGVSLRRLAGEVRWVDGQPVTSGGRELWVKRFKRGSSRTGEAAIFTVCAVAKERVAEALVAAESFHAKAHTLPKEGEVVTLESVGFCMEAPSSKHPIWGKNGLSAGNRGLIEAALRLGAAGAVFTTAELSQAALVGQSKVWRALQAGPGARTLMTAGFLERYVDADGKVSRSTLMLGPTALTHAWDAVAADWGLVDKQPALLKKATADRAAREAWHVQEASRAHLWGRPPQARDDLTLRRSPAQPLLKAIAAALVDVEEREVVRTAVERALKLDRLKKIKMGVLTEVERKVRQVAARDERHLKAILDPELLAEHGLLELVEQLRVVLWAPPGSLAPFVAPIISVSKPRVLSVVNVPVVGALPVPVLAVSAPVTRDLAPPVVAAVAVLPAHTKPELSRPRGALVVVPEPRRPTMPIARTTGDQQDIDDQKAEDAENAWGRVNLEAYFDRYDCFPPAESLPVGWSKEQQREPAQVS